MNRHLDKYTFSYVNILSGKKGKSYKKIHQNHNYLVKNGGTVLKNHFTKEFKEPVRVNTS